MPTYIIQNIMSNFAAEKASLLGACPQQGVGMKVKNKP